MFGELSNIFWGTRNHYFGIIRLNPGSCPADASLKVSIALVHPGKKLLNHNYKVTQFFELSQYAINYDKCLSILVKYSVVNSHNSHMT